MAESIANNKRLAKNTLYLYVRSIITLIVTLYTSRVVLDQLGVSDYGIYNVVASVSTFMTIVSGPLLQAMCRFMSFEIVTSDRERLQKLYSTCLNIIFFASILCFLILETVGLWFVNSKLVIPDARMTAANIAYQGSIVIFLVGLCTTVFNAEIVAHENMKAFARIAIVDVIMRLLIALSLPIIKGDKLAIYSVLLVAQSICTILLYVLYCRKNYPECSYVRVFDKQCFSKLFSFTGWSFIASVSFIIKETGINFVLNIFCGPVVNAARAVAGQVINSTSILGTQFLQATVPQITKLYADDNIKEMHLLISRSCRYAFLLFFCVAFPVFCYTPQILGIWLVEVPPLSSAFIRILLFQVLIKVMSSPLVTGINSTGTIKSYTIAFSIMEVLTFPAAYILLKLGYSPLVTAVIIVCAELIEMLIKYYYSRRNYGLSLKSLWSVAQRALPIFVLSVGIYFIAQHFKLEGIIPTLIGFSIVLLLNGVSIALIGIDRNEKKMLHAAIKLRIKK